MSEQDRKATAKKLGLPEDATWADINKHISEQDRNDIIFACHNEGDFLAASFVSCKEDILAIREIINNEGSNM